ncbi:Uma2 family endonuclease [Polyangium jinanense]|uniref:Uma2 family endonuclease n=1 Tax=Polyangium jinanense TaxID=2829994 RepID=A0A9X3X0J8_9BACT|nr:Uma2 family endonuclease [Polyangium jinanense]MDC3952384.1 Uma2 family endonuclease [Polyangium jinanense]MDC3980013.1 Uma2 family endonuclease [Polyangium jinanense]
MAADAARKRATYEDLLALPPNVKGEILDGVLYTQPRPRFRHVHGASSVQEQLGPPFRRGIGGPGGWWIATEPGIELPDSPEVSPDLAGWRRERMPDPPGDDPIKIVPDWVCEIFSPSTRDYDQQIKKPFYAKHGVRWLWFIDPAARVLMAHRLENGRWLDVGTWRNDDRARIEPFDAIELDLSDLWLPAKG